MSKGRHDMHRAKGGKTPMVDKGREEDEEDDMDDGRSKGGRAKRARGGGMEMGEGMKPKSRMDRPGRKRGGGVGANLTPLSTANRVKDADGHSTDTGSLD